MQKITSIINNQQGSVIIMAVIVLALLTVIGISATNTSTTEVQVSTNAMLHNIAFYTADSGIAAGRATLNNLKIADAGSWDILLRNLATDPAGTEAILWNGADCTTLDDIIDADGGRTVGPATFTLAIEDNDDLDGNDEVDSDDTVFLTSTLVDSYRNATATISTSVRGGGEAYAQEHYNASSSGEAGMESEKVNTDDGNRWD
jgi:hypothetical protein